MSFGAKFLTYPDLFPARMSGERWGEEELVVEFAGGPYRFRGLSELQANGLHTRLGELCTSAEIDRAVDLRVYRVDTADFLERETEPWEPYSLDEEFSADSVRIAGPDWMARIEWGPELSAAVWTSVEEPLAELVGVFENFFRVVVAYRLLEEGGALLHSAAVIDNDEAFVFVGQSGAGKSTISKISLESGREVLSDDMNALFRRDGGAVIEKVPFAGDLGQTSTRSRAYPVRGIFRLIQAEEPSLETLPAPQALATLITCTPFLNTDEYRMETLIGNLSTLLDEVELGRLAFALDVGFWKLLREGDGREH